MKVRQGHPQGAGNYSSSDINALLDYVKEDLPLGQRGWQSVTTKFNKYERHGQLFSSSHIFLQLIKTPKPTGTGICPPDVLQAHHIDDLINEQVGTHEFNDSGFDDTIEADKSGASDDNDNTNTPPEPCHTSVAHSAHTGTPPTHCNARGAAATELMNCLSNAFDPEVQRAHDEEHTNCALATTQYLTLSQQLHDAQVMNDKLHNQIYGLHNELYEAQHHCDHAEMQLEMLCMSHHSGGWPARMYHNLPKHKWQSYKWFADGGESLAWLSGDEEDTDDFCKKGSASETCKPTVLHTCFNVMT
ncbi:hypothetical protein PISMIDRAFT_112790 [Pisolithus microcarpus 441]|uniref:DUF6818 domain-containing protein n=1 Tax=Pisolithus microcarpus 441 TaxID=765257 RepID=A0A0C9XWD3_9AGAM|nr:hypothetical protein PISMIDRAFT_112790 [Pisolithus microcarpus 441]